MKSDAELLQKVKDLMSSGCSKRELIKSAKAIGISVKKLWKILDILEEERSKNHFDI